uniref:Uncharacterized protein n=1 Tax=Siphoviridae sp. ctgaY24 TaxID=2827911 RepID=A0A8S5SB97_9CAUD|nr:MAG TPA: hypothetical protein [Siphoviridae sp. ctgaY24]
MPYKCTRGLTCKKVVGEVCCFQKTIKDRKTASYGFVNFVSLKKTKFKPLWAK